ncbi:nucleoside triphosphate pyrophosphatase [Thalassotalea aquiviva]|uniref:Maf family protein n=1 Tax=Thalassotalea aquiviva TaxID=3242415 RepID=UPI00352A7A07
MLYLASQSPRRQELLAQLTPIFRILPSHINEDVRPNEQARDYVNRMAIEKAEACLQQVNEQGAWVLGSDTIVVSHGNILGKPENQDHFIAMMSSLQGATHQVMTAIALISNEHCFTQTVVTDVTFRRLSRAEMLAYWQTGEPEDKAGGYGIQGIAGKFVKKINGSYSSVVGLPLYETEQLLIKANLGMDGV